MNFLSTHHSYVPFEAIGERKVAVTEVAFERASLFVNAPYQYSDS